jgi:hypothetical protein
LAPFLGSLSKYVAFDKIKLSKTWRGIMKSNNLVILILYGPN